MACTLTIPWCCAQALPATMSALEASCRTIMRAQEASRLEPLTICHAMTHTPADELQMPCMQNVGNFITDKPSSRVLAPPGGASQVSQQCMLHIHQQHQPPVPQHRLCLETTRIPMSPTRTLPRGLPSSSSTSSLPHRWDTSNLRDMLLSRVAMAVHHPR